MSHEQSNRLGVDRRRFLRGCVALAGGLVAPDLLAAIDRKPERKLSFLHTHTGERETITYWAEGAYIAESLSEINHLLRDHRTGESVDMDRGLLDMLYRLQTAVGKPGEFQIISGYRSPKTNQMLRKGSSGVAKRSLHMQGRAMDIRLPGVELSQLRKAAIALQAGGVGYYPKSDFIHVDTGRVRYW